MAVCLALYAASFAVRSLHAVDLAPDMYSHEQPGTRMAGRYDESAMAMLRGGGILFPRTWPDRSDTGLLSRPPGYPLFLSLVYAGLGRSFYAAQLVQNLLNSLAAVLLFLLGSRWLGWRVGAAAGLLAATSASLAHYSNVIVPDALCVLPVLAAVVLAFGRGRSAGGLGGPAAAGALLGAATWLRPNLLLVAPFLAAVMVVAARKGRRVPGRAAVLVLSCAAVVCPITLRNYLIYGELVPISINGGIVLWQGIADLGGERFGARGWDVQVARREAREHDDPRYARWWASPDGIQRDRERMREAFEVILGHPGWFFPAVAKRAWRMLDEGRSTAPLVASDVHGELAPTAVRAADPDRPRPAPVRIDDRTALGPGAALGVLRRPTRWLQAGLRRTMLIASLAGILLVGLLAWRRALLLGAVPLYYLLVQSLFRVEFRVTLPMLALLYTFAATAWVAAGAGLVAGLRRLRSPGARGRPGAQLLPKR
jgi:Dolichyl-phosphate-mannose-protein mannosyltransferase